ncbi:hypothetical protein AAMO2058_000782100 [Amorphochlora amoebiformis]|uniref:Sulfotransferase domain-containing protein n=1 Tax=Amorphochlora amoebiformis TaxID=1561963 RepID=A0A7S0DLS2_9EUKA|mmetsp:Transcript_33477/g.53834  ORF Transcript_33477/g.53834 Transcript_33477/m.53834 type:complete len:534 (+) Transcript_33477:387-1988(+)
MLALAFLLAPCAAVWRTNQYPNSNYLPPQTIQQIQFKPSFVAQRNIPINTQASAQYQPASSVLTEAQAYPSVAQPATSAINPISPPQTNTMAAQAPVYPATTTTATQPVASTMAAPVASTPMNTASMSTDTTTATATTTTTASYTQPQAYSAPASTAGAGVYGTGAVAEAATASTPVATQAVSYAPPVPVAPQVVGTAPAAPIAGAYPGVVTPVATRVSGAAPAYPVNNAPATTVAGTVGATSTYGAVAASVGVEKPAATILAPFTGEVTKFFLLATPRSGSTWLSLLFRNHDETMYHGNECWRSEEYVQFCASEWNKDAKVPTGATLADKLDLLFKPNSTAMSTGAGHVGFKWMVQQGFKTETQFNEALKYINENNVKVIALDRSNYLRKCYSFYDMKERGKAGINVHHYGKSLNTGNWDNKTYTITADFLGGCLSWYETQGNSMHNLVNKMEKPENALLIRYEDMCSDVTQQLKNIKSFLGLKTDIVPKTNIKKIHSGSLSEMINNWAELRPRLMAGKYAKYMPKWESQEC